MRKHTIITPLKAVNWKALGALSGLFLVTMAVHSILYKNCPHCLYEWLFAIFICPIVGLLLAIQLHFDFKKIDKEHAPALAALAAEKQALKRKYYPMEVNNQLSIEQLKSQVETFNRAYKVGDKVEVFKTSKGNDFFVDEIKHQATVLGGHTAMTWLKEKGSYDLTFVKGISNASKSPLSTSFTLANDSTT